MARLDEIAEGLSSVLAATPTPEPLSVDMVGQSPAEITFFIRAVVDACERRGMPLALIRADQRFGSHAARALGPEPLSYQGTIVELVADRDHQIEFYRFQPSQTES